MAILKGPRTKDQAEMIFFHIGHGSLALYTKSKLENMTVAASALLYLAN